MSETLPPIGMELGRAAALPDFDPHAREEEVDPGREFGDQPEARVTTMVFFGVDQGGDFEDTVQEVVNFAMERGLVYVT
jgi:hypothetical protein